MSRPGAPGWGRGLEARSRGQEQRVHRVHRDQGSALRRRGPRCAVRTVGVERRVHPEPRLHDVHVRQELRSTVHAAGGGRSLAETRQRGRGRVSHRGRGHTGPAQERRLSHRGRDVLIVRSEAGRIRELLPKRGGARARRDR